MNPGLNNHIHINQLTKMMQSQKLFEWQLIH